VLRRWAQARPQDSGRRRIENYLPQAVRDALPALTDELANLARLQSEHTGADGSSRLLVALADGQTVEAVLLPPGGARKKSHGLCVSTQVGCAVGCVFCTTSARARTRRAHARSPAAASPALLEHLAAAHSCHVDKVEYGKALCLRVPASERRRRLLVGEEDKRVFLLAMAAVGAASAVTLVRVAASAETAARYRCKMWANAPAAAAAAVAGAASGSSLSIVPVLTIDQG